MASQPCKRLKRINELRRQVPHVTKDALHQVLSHVEEHGIPENHNPKHMRKATQQDLAQWDAYSPLLVTKQLAGVSGHDVCQSVDTLARLLQAGADFSMTWCSTL